MAHDMTEHEREPKDGEWWWCQVHNLTELQALQCAGKEPNEDFYNWNVHEDFYDDVTPIAPVASHELVRELISAVMFPEDVMLRRDVLDKVEKAGLDVPMTVAVAKDTIRELKFKNVKHSVKSPMGTDMLLCCSGLLWDEVPKNLEFKVSQKRRPKP